MTQHRDLNLTTRAQQRLPSASTESITRTAKTMLIFRERLKLTMLLLRRIRLLIMRQLQPRSARLQAVQAERFLLRLMRASVRLQVRQLELHITFSGFSVTRLTEHTILPLCIRAFMFRFLIRQVLRPLRDILLRVVTRPRTIHGLSSRVR
ncbi:unknown [Ruminococcus sp. CAG:563]|nr:unknown [Ruminococcus sp. CAG:563]